MLADKEEAFPAGNPDKKPVVQKLRSSIQRSLGWTVASTSPTANAPAHGHPRRGRRRVLVCDHASHHLPARYGLLGLTAEDLLKHFAWDPGALALSRRLSVLLDAPLVYGCVSRLALDVNRDPSDFDVIIETADGALVPGNSGLTAGERERRVAEIYTPYHAAVEDLLAKRAQRGQRSVHQHHTQPSAARARNTSA